MGLLDWWSRYNKKHADRRERRAARLRQVIWEWDAQIRKDNMHADVQYALSPHDAEILRGKPCELHTFFTYRLPNNHLVRIRVAPIGDQYVSDTLIIHDPDDYYERPQSGPVEGIDQQQKEGRHD